MTPYDQKTDSREFAVAGQGQAPSAAGADATDIVIRLWGLQGYNRPGSLTWNSDSVCLFMIADLIAASRGRIAGESPAVMAAHFDSPGQALVAAKRIQTTILEFLSGGPGEAVGAAILIYQPQSAQLGGREMVRTSLAQARPGQILFPENLSRRWRDVPGLDFRAVPAMTSAGAEQAGLVELIWTTPEQSSRLQSLVPEEAPEPKPAAPAMGATAMVNLPVRRSRGDAAREGTTPPTATGDFVFKSPGEATPPPPAPQPQPPTPSHAIPPEAQEEAPNPLLRELEEPRPFLTRGKILVGVAALILVAALITVLNWPVPPARVRIPATDTYEGGTAPNGKPPVKPVAEQPPPEQPQPVPPKIDAKVKPPEKKPPVIHQPPVAPVKPVEPPVVVEEVGGLSRKDIPQLLKMARKNAGEGRYDDARIAYRKILQLQPDNQDARDGLHKLDLIKSNSDQ